MFRINAADHAGRYRERLSRRCFLRAGVAGASSACLATSLWAAPEAAPPPLALHPDNPHYFLWRGEPTLLIGSGEHYGAVLNRRFDYRKYLQTLVHVGAYTPPINN